MLTKTRSGFYPFIIFRSVFCLFLVLLLSKVVHCFVLKHRKQDTKPELHFIIFWSGTRIADIGSRQRVC